MNSQKHKNRIGIKKTTIQVGYKFVIKSIQNPNSIVERLEEIARIYSIRILFWFRTKQLEIFRILLEFSFTKKGNMSENGNLEYGI
jgi:type III secretory pathway component EscU